MTGGVTTAQEKEGDPHSRVQVKLEVLNLYDGLPGAASGSLVSVGDPLGTQKSIRKDSAGKVVYARTIEGQSRWLPGNAIEMTLEITENDVKRTETVLLEGFEPKTLVLREDPAHGRRELLRLIPVFGPLDMGHALVTGSNPREPLDPEPAKFRLLSPVLVRDNQVLVNMAGSMATATEDDPAASLYSPGLGRFIFSSVPFEGAIEGKLRFNQVSFTLEGKSYLLLTGAPISVSQTVWVVHQPFWRPSASELSALGDHPMVSTSSRKTVITSKTTVSPDDKTLSFEFSDSSATNADPVTGKGEATRVGKGPAGSHAISGSWRTTKMENFSDNGLTVSFKVENDSLSMTNLTGQSYTAKLDGTEAPYKGDPGTTSVSVKRIDKNTIEETDKREGKVIAVLRLTVSSDGKSMTAEVNDKLHGTTSRFVAEKQ